MAIINGNELGAYSGLLNNTNVPLNTQFSAADVAKVWDRIAQSNQIQKSFSGASLPWNKLAPEDQAAISNLLTSNPNLLFQDVPGKTLTRGATYSVGNPDSSPVEATSIPQQADTYFGNYYSPTQSELLYRLSPQIAAKYGINQQTVAANRAVQDQYAKKVDSAEWKGMDKEAALMAATVLTAGAAGGAFSGAAAGEGAAAGSAASSGSAWGGLGDIAAGSGTAAGTGGSTALTGASSGMGGGGIGGSTSVSGLGTGTGVSGLNVTGSSGALGGSSAVGTTGLGVGEIGTYGSLGSGLLSSAGGSGGNTSTTPTQSTGTNTGGLLNTLNSPGGAALIGGVLGGVGGSEEAGTTTTTQVPWSAQQPYLLDLFQKSQNLANTPVDTTLTNQASGVYSNLLSTDPTNSYGMNQSNPMYGKTTAAATNPYLGVDNPYLQSTIDYANQDVTRSMLPAINQANAGSGSYGNSGVADYYSKALADAYSKNATTMRAADYTNQQNLAQNMSQFNAGLSQADTSRNANLWSTDQARDQQSYQYNTGLLSSTAQNASAYASNVYNNQWAPVQNYGKAVTGNYGSSTSTPYYENPYANVIGGISTGLGLYNAYTGSK